MATLLQATKYYLTIWMFCLYSSVVSEEIWSDPMNDLTTLTQWTGTANVTLSNNLHGTQYCAHGNASMDPCWAVCNNVSIYTSLSTTGYMGVKLTFDINPYSFNTPNCVISYNIVQVSAEIWDTIYNSNGSDTAIVSSTLDLSTSAWDMDVVDLQIAAIGPLGSCCYVSNLILNGTQSNLSISFNLLHTAVSWNQANLDCQTYFGTQLATILDADTDLLATKMCGDFCLNTTEADCACWIGVNRLGNSDIWQWEDGTALSEYGFNIDGTATRGEGPWHTGDPNQGATANAYGRIGPSCAGSGCVNKQLWTWADRTDAEVFYPLCNRKYPTEDPTKAPTVQPTEPTVAPTIDPTADPTFIPTVHPTTNPTVDPTKDPTHDPTPDPTGDPTLDPTADPTTDPTCDPTTDPTFDPTSDPTTDPTVDPTVDPTADPTIDPTRDPTTDPTKDPTIDPTYDPTSDPTMDPTRDPTSDPTSDPTQEPTQDPTYDPIGNITYDWVTSVPLEDKGVMGGGLFFHDAYSKFEVTMTMQLELLKSLNRLRWEYRDWDALNFTSTTNWTEISKTYFKNINIYTAPVTEFGKLNELGYDADDLVYTSVLTISTIRTLNSGYCYNVTSAPSHILQPGRRYGFRVYVIADSIINDRYDEYFHSDILNLTTNQFATDGQCILELTDKTQTQARLLDKFYFDCTGWIDPDSLQGNFSLKFNGLMNDVLINNALLSKLWTTQPSTIIGMIGTKALEIKTLIRDDLGAITCHTIDIDQSFPSASLTDEEILEAIKRIISENDLGKDNSIAVALDTILEGLLFIEYANDAVLAYIMDLVVQNVVNTSYATNPSETSSGRVLSESIMMKGLLSEERLIFGPSATLLVDQYLPSLYSTIDQEIIIQPAIDLDPSIGDSLNQIALKSFNLAGKLEYHMATHGLNDFDIDHNKALESFVSFSSYSGHIALAQSYPGAEFTYEDEEGTKKIFTTKIDPNSTDIPRCGIDDGNSIEIPAIFDTFYDCSFVEQLDAYFEPGNSYKQVETDRDNTLSNTVTVDLYDGDVYNSVFDTRRRRRRRRLFGEVLDLSTSLLESTKIKDKCSPYWIHMLLNQNTKGLYTLEQRESNSYTLGEGTPYPACTFWNTESKQWDTSDCFVYNYTEEYVLCGCEHLTTFNIKASDFKPQVNMITIYDLRDLSNENLKKYPTVWVALVATLTLFIFVCILDAWKSNKDDKSPLAYSDIMFVPVREHKMKSFLPSTTTHIFEKLYDKKHKHYGVGLIKTIRKDNRLCINQLRLFRIYLPDNHTLLSVFQHSEGTGYSRRERLASFYLYLSTIMVSSAVFYGVEQQRFGDMTASFLISLWSTCPALFVKFSFKKAKPSHTPLTINISGVKQQTIDAIDLSKLPTDVENNELKENDAKRYSAIYKRLEAHAKFAFVDKAMMDEVNEIIIRSKHKTFRMAFLDYTRIKLLRQDHAWPHWMKYVAWIFLIFWCGFCSLIAIVYGIQFDLLYETGPSTEYSKMGYDESCWSMDPQLLINDELSQAQIAKDIAGLNDNFGAHISDSKSWLLQLFQSVLVSIFLWQPLTIYFVTWLNIWLFSWNLPVSLKPQNLLKLFKNVFGMQQKGAEGTMSDIIELEVMTDDSKHKQIHKLDTMDIAKLIQNNPEFQDKMQNEETTRKATTKPDSKDDSCSVLSTLSISVSVAKPNKVKRRHQKQRSRSFDFGVLKEGENFDVFTGTTTTSTLTVPRTDDDDDNDEEKKEKKEKKEKREKRGRVKKKGKPTKKRSKSMAMVESNMKTKHKKENKNKNKSKSKSKNEKNVKFKSGDRGRKKEKDKTNNRAKKRRTKSVIVAPNKSKKNGKNKDRKGNKKQPMTPKPKGSKKKGTQKAKTPKPKAKNKASNAKKVKTPKTKANRKGSASKSMVSLKKRRTKSALPSGSGKTSKTPKARKSPNKKNNGNKPKKGTRKKRAKTITSIQDIKPKTKTKKKKKKETEEAKTTDDILNGLSPSQDSKTLSPITPFSFDLSSASKTIVVDTTTRYKSTYKDTDAVEGVDDNEAEVIYDEEKEKETETEKEKDEKAKQKEEHKIEIVSLNSNDRDKPGSTPDSTPETPSRLFRYFSLSSLSRRDISDRAVVSPFSVTVERSLRSVEDFDLRQTSLNAFDELYKNIVSHQFRPFDVYAFFGTQRYFLEIVKTWYGLDILGYAKPKPVVEVEEEEEEEAEEEEEESESESEEDAIERQKSKRKKTWESAVSWN